MKFLPLFGALLLASCAAYVPEVNAAKLAGQTDAHILDYWKVRNTVCRSVADGRHLRMHQENARNEALKRGLVRKSAVPAIEQGSAVIGMTENEAKAAWGFPSDINRTISSYGTREQWVYGGSYLYFEDGTLTTIQN